MKKSATKQDRPDRAGNLMLSPIMSAVVRAYSRVKRAEPSKKLGVSPAPVRFEAIEPRVLLSGDVNPAALTVSGTIVVLGEQDRYEFTVDESRRVVFDSLTNRSDINWTLSGPSGQVTSRSFTNTDYNATSQAFELTPSKYQILVDGSGDAIGDYSLRLVDADAAADLQPDTAVSGTLDGGNKTAVYRFTATAGDKFYFQNLGSDNNVNADWRLIDPFGRQEGSIHYIRSDQDLFAAQYSGEYLLLVEGHEGNTSPVNYKFNLRTVTDSTHAMTLDSVTNAVIDKPGKIANFTFHLDAETAVIFDKLKNSSLLLVVERPSRSASWPTLGRE